MPLRKFIEWIDKQIKTLGFGNRSHAVEYAIAKLKQQEENKT